MVDYPLPLLLSRTKTIISHVWLWICKEKNICGKPMEIFVYVHKIVDKEVFLKKVLFKVKKKKNKSKMNME